MRRNCAALSPTPPDGCIHVAQGCGLSTAKGVEHLTAVASISMDGSAPSYIITIAIVLKTRKQPEATIYFFPACLDHHHRQSVDFLWKKVLFIALKSWPREAKGPGKQRKITDCVVHYMYILLTS
jgi:hypothetical protein